MPWWVVYSWEQYLNRAVMDVRDAGLSGRGRPRLGAPAVLAHARAARAQGWHGIALLLQILHSHVQLMMCVSLPRGTRGAPSKLHLTCRKLGGCCVRGDVSGLHQTLLAQTKRQFIRGLLAQRLPLSSPHGLHVSLVAENQALRRLCFLDMLCQNWAWLVPVLAGSEGAVSAPLLAAARCADNPPA